MQDETELEDELGDEDELELGTVEEACAVIGGNAKPVHKATFYRGVHLGLWDPPVHPSPGISRVVMPKLRASIRRRIEGGE